MQIAVIALLCHAVGSVPEPVCLEALIARQEVTSGCAAFSEPALLAWKETSVYRGDAWMITGIKCEAGNYVIEGAT